MAGEDQERFENYLELERFITDLQAGRAASPPAELTPTQARVYRMAMLFHAATPDVSAPDPLFAEELQARLEQKLQALSAGSPPRQESAPVPQVPPRARKRHFPRRLLLVGGVSAAASLVVGAGIEHVVEQAVRPNSEVTITVASPLDWFPVTTMAEMGDRAIKFRTVDQRGALSLTGYVLCVSDKGGQDRVIAMSAACTHKGCIVEWSGTDRKFHCPCHGGVFGSDGGIDAGSSSLYLNPLPLLDVKVDSTGQVFVRMPGGSW